MQADIAVFEIHARRENWIDITELNWAVPEATVRWAIGRLQPDIEGTKFKYFFSHYVYRRCRHCSWRYDEENDPVETTLAGKSLLQVTTAKSSLSAATSVRQAHEGRQPRLATLAQGYRHKAASRGRRNL